MLTPLRDEVDLAGEGGRVEGESEGETSCRNDDNSFNINWLRGGESLAHAPRTGHGDRSSKFERFFS